MNQNAWEVGSVLSLGIALILAGCQGQEVRLQLMSPGGPGQAGLKFEPIQDFVRAAGPEGQFNLGQDYRDRGLFEYRVFRVMNQGSEAVEILPNLRSDELADADAELTQRFWSAQSPGTPIGIYNPPVPTAAGVWDYHSEFKIVEAGFYFESGARGKVLVDEEPTEKNISEALTLRAGESMEYRVRLKILSGIPLIQSQAFLAEVYRDLIGRFFISPEVPADLNYQMRQISVLCRLNWNFRSSLSMIYRDPVRNDWHPLNFDEGKYLSAAQSEPVAPCSTNANFPEITGAQAARLISGLAVAL